MTEWRNARAVLAARPSVQFESATPEELITKYHRGWCGEAHTAELPEHIHLVR
jgi:hypothetical protein